MSVTYQIEDAVNDAYKRLSTRKTKAMVLKIEPNPDRIVLEKEYPKADFSHETFLNELPELECRYVIYLYEFTTNDGIVSDQIFFILYNPIKCKPNLKFRYTSGKGTIEGTYSSISKTLQVGGIDELTEEKLQAKVK